MGRLSLAQVAKDLGELARTVEENDRILVRGAPDSPSIVEKVRRHDDTFRELAFWMRSIALLFMGQFITVLFSVIYFFVNLLPTLMRLANSDRMFDTLRVLAILLSVKGAR